MSDRAARTELGWRLSLEARADVANHRREHVDCTQHDVKVRGGHRVTAGLCDVEEVLDAVSDFRDGGHAQRACVPLDGVEMTKNVAEKRRVQTSLAFQASFV